MHSETSRNTTQETEGVQTSRIISKKRGYISTKPKKGEVDDWNFCSDYNCKNCQIHNPGKCNCREVGSQNIWAWSRLNKTPVNSTECVKLWRESYTREDGLAIWSLMTKNFLSVLYLYLKYKYSRRSSYHHVREQWVLWTDWYDKQYKQAGAEMCQAQLMLWFDKQVLPDVTKPVFFTS